MLLLWEREILDEPRTERIQAFDSSSTSTTHPSPIQVHCAFLCAPNMPFDMDAGVDSSRLGAGRMIIDWIGPRDDGLQRSL
jgi:hypothetical protein